MNSASLCEVMYEMSKRHGYAAKAVTTSTPKTPSEKLQNVAAAQAAAKKMMMLDGL
jgi:hypothetical protein